MRKIGKTLVYGLAQLRRGVIRLVVGGRRVDSPIAMEAARRILVVKLDGIGDYILCIPFLRTLRSTAPSATVTLVVSSSVMPLAERNATVDRVVPYTPASSVVVREVFGPIRAFRFGRSIRAAYDLALIPRWDFDKFHAAFVALGAGAACRVGFSEDVSEFKRRRNPGYDRLLDVAVHEPVIQHEVEANLALLSRLGVRINGRDRALELPLQKEDTDRAMDVVGSLVDTGRPIVALGIGAGAPFRRWPVGRFVELGRELARARDVNFLVVGGAEDADVGRQVADAIGSNAVTIAGALSLPTTAAALRLAAVFVGNDSGPMHLAGAVGVPVVEISCHAQTAEPGHPNSPLRFAPWGVPSEVLRPRTPASRRCRSGCSAMQPHCILGIDVSDALDAVSHHLQDASAARLAGRTGIEVP